jgi:16S rRNA C1402 (ribose-2'-O) methylase RsmI
LEALEKNYPETQVILGRELTKLHEEMLIGTPAELLQILTNEPVRQKGEFVVIFKNSGQNLPKGRTNSDISSE